MQGFKDVFGVVLAGALCVTGAAIAQDDLPGEREAKRMLFGIKGSDGEVYPHASLSEKDQGIVASLIQTQKYYGAIAFSPDEGLLSEATVAAANYHDIATARDAALAGCNDKRASGAARCVIVAEIRPKRYQPGRAVQMSMDATYAFGREYRREDDPKSFATSAATGFWGFAGGDAEAIAVCNAKGASDCQVVVRD